MSSPQDKHLRLWHVVLFSALFSLLFFVVLLAFGWVWLRDHGRNVHIPLGGQRMMVELPATVPVQARMNGTTKAQVNARVPVDVGVNQVVSVPMNQTLKAQVHFDHDVPVHAVVDYNGSVRIDQSLPVDTTVKVTVLGISMKVPVKGMVPVHAVVPVHLKVPIDQSVHLTFTAPVSAHVNQTLKVPLRTTMHANVTMDHVVDVKLDGPMNAQVLVGQRTVPILIKSWDFRLPKFLVGDGQ